MLRVLAFLGILGLCAQSWAEPKVKLRMAAIAPEGTAWAREVHAFTRDVSTGTNGRVELKWYLGGIAGDELTALKRVKKGQLDGLAGALMCERIAPSLWVTRIVGLFRNANEAHVILNRLRPTVARELEQNGFVDIGLGSFGSEVFFTRQPVQTLNDLRKIKFWTWSLDQLWVKELPAMGFSAVPLPVEEAAQAYDDGRIDGFIGVPSAALAYQWSSRAKHFINLSVAFLPACVVMSQRAYASIPIEDQKVVSAAAAKLEVRFNDIAQRQDEQLLGRLFEHQGLTKIKPSASFVSEFFATTDRVRQQLGGKLVPERLLADVNSWLTELRSGKAAQ